MRKQLLWVVLWASGLLLVACGDGGNVPSPSSGSNNPNVPTVTRQDSSVENVSNMNENNLNQVKPATTNLPAPPKLSNARPAPDFDNTAWINSAPLALENLKGKVKIVEFWTFGCYNCRNVQPALKRWYNDYKQYGFEIVAFHAPEFDYEKKLENVQDAVAKEGLKYPVAIDNDFKTWGKYRVNAWPTMFLLDKENRIRYTHIGEGRYEEIEAAIVTLLNEK